MTSKNHFVIPQKFLFFFFDSQYFFEFCFLFNFIGLFENRCLPIESLHNELLLIKAMQNDDESAFTVIYHHYSPILYLNILRMVRDPQVAEEIVQELFTRIWKKRSSQGITENFTGYMYRTSQNLVHDFFRSLKRDAELKERFLVMASENYESAENRLFEQRSMKILKEAIKQLPPQQKKVYQLVKVEGCTYKKAAEILGISPFTVKEYIVATQKTIRKYVAANLGSSIPELLLLLIFIPLAFV